MGFWCGVAFGCGVGGRRIRGPTQQGMMFTRCLFCHKPFPENGQLAHMSSGRRIATTWGGGCIRCAVPTEDWASASPVGAVTLGRPTRSMSFTGTLPRTCFAVCSCTRTSAGPPSAGSSTRLPRSNKLVQPASFRVPGARVPVEERRGVRAHHRPGVNAAAPGRVSPAPISHQAEAPTRNSRGGGRRSVAIATGS